MLNTIFKHRSIRKFKSDPIAQDVLQEILEAGIRASNTGNMQAYSFVVTQVHDLKEKLWEAHFKQEMVKQAPVVITFCADFNRVARWCSINKAQPGFDNFQSFTAAAIDALLASQNVVLAAEEKGLGICYLGTTTYMTSKIIEILSLPKLVVPITTIVVGYAEEIPDLTDRLPLNSVVHNETYTDYSDSDIRYMYKDKENLDFYKNLVKINNKETLAQVFTDNRYKKADNQFFSKTFLEALTQQGFMNND